VAGSCEYGDEPSGSGARELVSYGHYTFLSATFRNPCYPRLVHVGGVRLSELRPPTGPIVLPRVCCASPR
jgi:hypothetical protein